MAVVSTTAQAAGWPRLAEARDNLEHGLALENSEAFIVRRAEA